MANYKRVCVISQGLGIANRIHTRTIMINIARNVVVAGQESAIRGGGLRAVAISALLAELPHEVQIRHSCCLKVDIATIKEK